MNDTFSGKKNHIDFMRLALAILVLFSHSFPLALGSDVTEPFSRLTRGQVTGGRIAVDCFFILSGFLISASFERSSRVGFITKRIARIYPGFLILIVVLVIAGLPLSHATVAGSSGLHKFANVSIHSLRLQEFVYTGAFLKNPYPSVIDGSLWSISYEAWCYVGVFLLGVVGWLRSKRILAVLFAASILVSVAFAAFQWTPGGSYLGVIFGYPPFWARLLPMYLAGVVFYRFRSALTISRKGVLLASAAVALACVIPLGYTILFPVFGTYLLFAFCYSHRLPVPRIARLGDFSYGAYLYAFPVQQVVMSRIGHSCSPYELFLLATPITLLLAAISWFLVERPSLRAAHTRRDLGQPVAAIVGSEAASTAA